MTTTAKEEILADELLSTPAATNTHSTPPASALRYQA
ncbi:hypothetical protein [Sporisorium scitamineum]|uniref:Uncharacterized protein n=1 Tax=Sporisorium scitamineum TaxID=49012 RepID=A0A0F7SDT5_9BASI|nr:hypothetical protein [Sporisorium scitamineum]